MNIEDVQNQLKEEQSIIRSNHVNAYMKLQILKKSNDDNIRGIALFNSTDRIKATKRIRNSFETTYFLTGLEDIKYGLDIIDEFIKNPTVINTFLTFTTNKNFIKLIKDSLDVDIDKILKNKIGYKYLILKKLKKYLNSSCYIDEIHIENSFQIHLALLYTSYCPTHTDENINKIVNKLSENIIEDNKYDIEPPKYNLGRLENDIEKTKSFFLGYQLLEVNNKNNKLIYQEDDEYTKIREELHNSNMNIEEFILKTFKDLL